MKCPYCGAEESKVIDSRPTEDSERIRRRRECLSCHMRFTTYEVVETLLSSYDREIPSVRIGELTMQELKKIDEVAYVRFASVYRQFADVESFFNELKKLMGDRKEPQK